MRYLAQVLPTDSASAPGFLLLALEKSDDTWSLLDAEPAISDRHAVDQLPGHWVILSLTEAREITLVQDAKPWILHLVKTYLVAGITPEFLKQEADRAEMWRQSLTLKNQEVDRRALELEARREQIQALEAELKREKQQLEEP